MSSRGPGDVPKTDTTSDASKLETLVQARRDELKRQRQEVPASAIAQPSTEEQLWDAVQQKLFLDRISEEQKRLSGERKAAREARMMPWTLVIAVVAILAAGAVGTMGIDLVAKFRTLAVAAAAVGAVGAFLRVVAHGGSSALDGLGKALGLVSALLAAAATFALLLLVNNPGF